LVNGVLKHITLIRGIEEKSHRVGSEKEEEE
jgi:hypothetical protein